MIVSVSAEGLTGDDLGKTIDQKYLNHLRYLGEKYGINIAGEGGEYETFVYGLGNTEIKDIKQEKIWKKSGGYLILRI